jgi:DNA-binding NtrC family response regulator
MIPKKLSAQVFLDIPPVLSHYLESERNQWIDSVPSRGDVQVFERPGVFVELENWAVERRGLLRMLGRERARALLYGTGFEQGRHDGARHNADMEGNARLALLAGPVFAQVHGRCQIEPVHFEFDLESRTLYRELIMHRGAEARVHRMIEDTNDQCSCWTMAGYLSGHVSEILGRRIVTMESECAGRGDACCRFISRLDAEWGEEADWTRQALTLKSVDQEIASRDALVSTAQENAKRAEGDLGKLNKKLRGDLMLENLIMQAECMQPIMKRARQAMPTDLPVLLSGEAGSGRETLARAIHAGGTRKSAPFVTVDCEGLQGQLLVRELIGYTEGSIPGATRGHTGALARANNGTLYLDELTNLNSEAQAALLSAMQTGEVTPAGSDRAVKCDIRVVAATDYDPHELRRDEHIRGDLMDALDVARIDIPPLRERGSDILRMAEVFLGEFRERYEKSACTLAEDFKQVLVDCAWPGNVRQLRNVVEHAVVFGSNGELGLGDLPEDILVTRLKKPAQELSAEVIRAALRRTRDNRSQAADLLGVGRTTLWRAMKRLGIE